MALFLDVPPAPDVLATVKNQAANEFLALGSREIYIWFGPGQGQSKMRIPAATQGTMRNMNTVAKLAVMGTERAARS